MAEWIRKDDVIFLIFRIYFNAAKLDTMHKMLDCQGLRWMLTEFKNRIDAFETKEL